MNRGKIIRLSRIMVLEEKKLDQLTLKLKQVNQQIAELQQRKLQIRQQQSTVMSTPGTSVSIVQLLQMSTYSGSVESRVQRIDERVQELATQQVAVLEEVAIQRTKIKGWQILIEKLRHEDVVAEEKVAMMAADDRVLRDLASNRRVK
jgi:flagellar biosynthesis chaperone FliJ